MQIKSNLWNAESHSELSTIKKRAGDIEEDLVT